MQHAIYNCHKIVSISIRLYNQNMGGKPGCGQFGHTHTIDTALEISWCICYYLKNIRASIKLYRELISNVSHLIECAEKE